MKFHHVLAVLTVPALFASAPLAATMPGSGAHAEDKANGETTVDPNKLVCKRFKESGSRLAGKKVCMTAAEWERQRREEQQMVERIQANRTKAE